MIDLYIKNGKDENDNPIELGINNGKIEAVAPKLAGLEAKKVIDLKGESYVSAGWIDDHTHCYEKLTLYYDDPDIDGYQSGVTTVIDAGSTGADNIDDFYQITRAKKTNVLAMLNISRTGILAQDELGDINKVQDELMSEKIEELSGFIVGIKARMSHSVVLDNGLEPLKRAKKIQKENFDIPLMVHVGSNPPELSGILDLMGPGDILTHAYNGKPNGIRDEEGNIKNFAWDAYHKGVIFDVGHGSDSFNFQTAKTAFQIGLKPKSLSTDIYHRNRENGPVYDMATCIEKMMALGYGLDEVIAMVTTAPADNFHLVHKGALKEGYDADVTIFNVASGTKELVDSDDNKMITHTLINPIEVVIGGQDFKLGGK